MSTKVKIEHYTHGQPAAPLTQEPVTDPDRVFYASTRNDGKVGFLAGPYDTHQEALDVVAPTKELATAADQWAVFYSFGTLSLPRSLATLPKGIFNRQVAEENS